MEQVLQEIIQARSQGGIQGMKRRILCRFRPKIERTDIQTVIASKNVVAHAPCKVCVDLVASASELDRQIRDAPGGVDDIGFSDGIGRAGSNSERTTPAEIRGGGVRRQIERRQNLPQHQPAAMFDRHEI